MYLIAIAVVLFVWIYLSHASRKHMRDAVSNIPGPYYIPLLGSLHMAFGINTKNVFTRSLVMGKQYGPIIKAWALHRLIIASSDAEINEQILTSPKHITKHGVYEILHPWLGTGLLTSDGNKWFARRKVITPSFHFKILEDFVTVFSQQSTILVDCLAKEADGKRAFNIYPYMCSATLDVIAETAMGTKVNAQTDKSMQYPLAVTEMTNITGWRFLRLHLMSDIVFTLLHPWKKWRTMQLIRILHDFTRNVIEKRRAALQSQLKSSDSLNQDDGIGAKNRMALLDVLLQSTVNGQPLTNEEIREEVDTFMFEGHDTTASALSCMLHLLARHPRVQEKLLDEIRQVFGDDTDDPSFSLSNLNDLKYMECVIKESLRMYPSVPIIARQITEDLHYKHSRLGNGVIPAGAEFIIFIFGMSIDANTFENPRSFIPERHDASDAKNGFKYIPFSAGPRNCIGQKFAMYEMKVMLTKILRAYELLPLGEDMEPVLSIVLRSSTGMQLGIKKRIS